LIRTLGRCVVRRRTIARQLEHDRAAEAETDGAEPPGIDLRQRGERGGRCPAARPDFAGSSRSAALTVRASSRSLACRRSPNVSAAMAT